MGVEQFDDFGTAEVFGPPEWSFAGPLAARCSAPDHGERTCGLGVRTSFEEALDDVPFAGGRGEMERPNPTALNVGIGGAFQERGHEVPHACPRDFGEVRRVGIERVATVGVRVEVAQHAELGAVVGELVDHVHREADLRGGGVATGGEWFTELLVRE